MTLNNTIPRRAVLRGLGATLALPLLDSLRAGPTPPVLIALGLTKAEYITNRDSAYKAGYRFLTLSVFGPPSSPFYNTVVIKRPTVVAQHDYPSLTGPQFNEAFADEAALGFGPVIIGATGPASSPLFAVVFEPQSPIPLTRFGLTSGDPTNPSTIQGVNTQAKSDGLILRCAAAYGDSGAPTFAGIWTPNPGNILWNADAVTDTFSGYQARVDAETSGWCRPSFVTLNQSDQYLSCFVDDEVAGSWFARHGLTLAALGTEVGTALTKGFFPICIQAAGSSRTSATCAAIFVTSEEIQPKKFTVSPSGPGAIADIDNVILKSMQMSPVKDASLAIVHGTELVYAQGYTLGESDWPTVSPTTTFRMASVSKTVTALAIFQLIAEGKLELSDHLQNILKLETPAGTSPADPKFKDITIQHLIEHSSGVMPQAVGDGVAVKKAFLAAGHSANLPVSAAMTDSYIASLKLLSTPGSTQAYNNCGYYLLGRVVAKLRGKNRPIDAYHEYLFHPLSITRIRRARSLITAQPSGEARYRDPSLAVYPSQMSNAQPLVPSVYGDLQLEILEGDGGLSGAATDLARLVAIFISTKDNPALTRKTLDMMLSAGAALFSAQLKIKSNKDPRAGYGFDALVNLGGDQYYGQKGGSLASSGNVLQFNGDWGFCMQWGGVNNFPGDWYPDFPEVMSIAKKMLVGASDLFPHYGMPAL